MLELLPDDPGQEDSFRVPAFDEKFVSPNQGMAKAVEEFCQELNVGDT